MHDDRGGGTVAGRFLIFVGPAAVIGHRAAVEEAADVRLLPVGIVDQDQHRLAAHVDAGIIVPALFGGGDAIADEDDRAVLHRDMRLDAVGTDHHLRPVGERDRRARASEGQRRDVLRGDLHQRHVLIPAALVAGREARRGEPLRQIGDGLLLPRRARGAALIGIGRQLLRHVLQRRFRYGRCGLRGGGHGGEREEREGKGTQAHETRLRPGEGVGAFCQSPRRLSTRALAKRLVTRRSAP